MKSRIIISLIILIAIISCSIKVEAYDSDLEYYNVTYDFINSTEYYLTYEFKAKE